MSVWFCSDLHFGHKNIQKFRHHVKDEQDNRCKILADWIECVSKRDDVYVLGDACFTMETLKEFENLKGRKFLIRGNHDKLNTSAYLKVFDEVYGLLKYKEFWLSHAPIHPAELRGRINLHGHVHYQNIQTSLDLEFHRDILVDDKRYFNCCVENVYAMKHRSLIRLEEIREALSGRGDDHTQQG